MEKKHEAVVVIATGGTFDKIYYDALSDYRIGDPQISGILSDAGVSDGDYTVASLLRKDSLDMDDSDRCKIREFIENNDAARFLIVHGTDTMPETARELAGIKGRTVVLTGAMQPARFKDSDAVFNSGFAYAAARLLSPGIYIAMNGRIFPADKVRKNRDAGRFEMSE